MKFPSEISFFRDELALPVRVARVSRLIGKSDTTANARCWQADSNPPGLPIPAGPIISRRSTVCQTQETPLCTEWRFNLLLWSLASRILRGRSLCLPYLLVASRPVTASSRTAEFAATLDGSLILCAGRDLPSSLHVTGAITLAIAVPYSHHLIFNGLHEALLR